MRTILPAHSWQTHKEWVRRAPVDSTGWALLQETALILLDKLEQ